MLLCANIANLGLKGGKGLSTLLLVLLGDGVLKDGGRISITHRRQME